MPTAFLPRVSVRSPYVHGADHKVVRTRLVIDPKLGSADELPTTQNTHARLHPNVESPSSNLSTSSMLVYGASPTRSAGSSSFKAAKTS